MRPGLSIRVACGTVLGVCASAYGQATPFLPQGPYFPYTNKDRSLDYARHYPVWRTGNVPMGSHQVFPPSAYNPVHPNADFDGDGIINRLDPDMDGDGILDYNDQIGGAGGDRAGWWTPPSENPSWPWAIPWWDAELKRVLQPPSGWWNDAPGVAVWNLHHDPDGDGTLNGYDDDDDGDGLIDYVDFDHPLAHPRGPQTANQDFDGDGIRNWDDEDADGDGWGDKLTSHPGADPSPHIYQPHPNATLDDWDGDGWPNGCDPEPLYRNSGPGPVLDDPYLDYDGDGWPNACDPEPCNPDVPGVDMSPNADPDGDGWPNRCDPAPCDPDVPASPPVNLEDPCGDGGGPPEPPPPPSTGNPPGPHERPDSNPPADDPNPPAPPDPPEPPRPPQIDPPGGGGGDDECCAAICERLDILIEEAAKEVEQLYEIHKYSLNMDYFLQLMYRRTISDPDSFRNRVDNATWTIADLLGAVHHEIQTTNALLGNDSDPDDWTPPSGNTDPYGHAYAWQAQPGAGTPGSYPERFHGRLKAYTQGDSDRPGWSGLSYFQPLADLATADRNVPVWELSIPTPDMPPFGGDPFEVTIDFAFFEPLRIPVHVVFYILAIVHCAGIVWEELRRYG